MEIDFSGANLMAAILWAILKVCVLMLAVMGTVLLAAMCAERLIDRAARIKAALIGPHATTEPRSEADSGH